MELSEFRELISACRKNENVFMKYTGAAFFIFQFHMIARLDDVFRFRREDITRNIEFPFALKSKMRWSKNVLEERDAPDQIILGAMDPSFCPLLAIAIHTEIPTRLGAIGLTEDDPSLFGVKKGKMASLFRQITSEPTFPQVIGGKIGTHSIRKLPATFARRNGCSRDDVDTRGRWKHNRRMVDTYIDHCIPYPDAKVASILCVGGAIKYMVREGSNISSDFILTHVCSNIKTVFPREVSLVLGTALLWAIYNDSISQILPQHFVDGVKLSVSQVGGSLLPNQNPVRKIPIIVSGDGGVLVITALNDNESQPAPQGQGQIELAVLLQQIQYLKQQGNSLETELHLLK